MPGAQKLMETMLPCSNGLNGSIFCAPCTPKIVPKINMEWAPPHRRPSRARPASPGRPRGAAGPSPRAAARGPRCIAPPPKAPPPACAMDAAHSAPPDEDITNPGAVSQMRIAIRRRRESISRYIRPLPPLPPGPPGVPPLCQSLAITAAAAASQGSTTLGEGMLAYCRSFWAISAVLSPRARSARH